MEGPFEELMAGSRMILHIKLEGRVALQAVRTVLAGSRNRKRRLLRLGPSVKQDKEKVGSEVGRCQIAWDSLSGRKSLDF